MTLLVEKHAHGKIVRTTNVDHVSLRVFDFRLACVLVLNRHGGWWRQDRCEQVTRQLGGVNPSLHRFHLLGRGLLSAWSVNAKDHSTTTAARWAPRVLAVQSTRIDQRGAESACVHCVF